MRLHFLIFVVSVSPACAPAGSNASSGLDDVQFHSLLSGQDVSIAIAAAEAAKATLLTAANQHNGLSWTPVVFPTASEPPNFVASKLDDQIALGTGPGYSFDQSNAGATAAYSWENSFAGVDGNGATWVTNGQHSFTLYANFLLVRGAEMPAFAGKKSTFVASIPYRIKSSPTSAFYKNYTEAWAWVSCWSGNIATTDDHDEPVQAPQDYFRNVHGANQKDEYPSGNTDWQSGELKFILSDLELSKCQGPLIMGVNAYSQAFTLGAVDVKLLTQD